MNIDAAEAAAHLKAAQDILILTHRKPDGDTLGCACALMYALRKTGKRAEMRNPDPIPARYSFLFDQPDLTEEFTPGYIVAVDVADTQLLGELQNDYIGKIDMCIDHHASNKNYAKLLLLDDSASAAAEIVYLVINKLGAPIDQRIADAIFTGITTDTGCFRYTNVTARTHAIAAEMIEKGARHTMINRLMFETKTKTRIAIEKEALGSLEYYFDGLCALIYLPKDLLESTGVDEDELEGVAAITRTIEGVDAGLTIRGGKDNTFRVSLRASDRIDASAICQKFGGGGHPQAAGCTLTGDIDSVKNIMLGEIGAALKEAGENGN